MARIATTIEESKRLLELGIDPNTADMRWKYNHNTHKHDDIPQVLAVRNWDDPYNKDIPAWSLGKLFDIAWELDPNQVLSFQKGEKMDLIAIMVDFIEMLVREVNTKGKE